MLKSEAIEGDIKVVRILRLSDIKKRGTTNATLSTVISQTVEAKTSRGKNQILEALFSNIIFQQLAFIFTNILFSEII